MIKAEELAKKMRKQRCHHCKDGRSFDGQFIFAGIKASFPYILSGMRSAAY